MKYPLIFTDDIVKMKKQLPSNSIGRTWMFYKRKDEEWYTFLRTNKEMFNEESERKVRGLIASLGFEEFGPFEILEPPKPDAHLKLVVNRK